MNSIFYWSDAQEGILEIYRILQEEGKVILNYTCKKDLEKKGFVQYGVKTYEAEEVHEMLAKAGLRDIKGIRSWDRHRGFMCVTGRK